MYRTFFVVAILALTAFSQNTQSVKGLKEKVSVARDSYSRPYISAANEADLYFAQGYVTASDRLWQMDMLRRVARGETAELSGARTLEEDKRWRRLGFAKTVDDSIQYLDPTLRAALESYTAGVNAYIASLNDQTLPVEFRILQYKPKPWTPSDSLIIGKILADALSSTWRQDLLKASLQATLPKQKFDELTDVRHDQDVILFGKDAPMQRPARQQGLDRDAARGSVSDNILAAAERIDAIRQTSLESIGLFAEDLAASNNWVISGKRTADGKPILANDPHLAPTAPGIWYLTHLETPTTRRRRMFGT